MSTTTQVSGLSPQPSTPTVLTIAGSDSSGGAGVDADIRTFDALGVSRASVVTCETVQTDTSVQSISPRGPDVIAGEIADIISGNDVKALKTGMLYSAEIIRAVTGAVSGLPNLVVDPVMCSTSGVKLLQDEALPVLCDELLPLSVLVTPNIPEAERLCGYSILGEQEMQNAALDISSRFNTACLVKGGHLDSAVCVDVLCEKGGITLLSSPRLDVPNVRGTGCMLSAAIAAYLADGLSLSGAVESARKHVLGLFTRG